MAIFKCKMCGTEINSDKVKKSCKKCGALYALVPVNEEIADLYEQADNLRRDCEFEKAESFYRNIISIDQTQADAYWGVVLCKYCVGCVNDRYMFSRVSACLGSSPESIKFDEDFLLALENGNDEQKSVYDSEAGKIIITQKEIFNVMRSEDPFDIFISYKQTGADGKPTKDSKTAESLYNQFVKDEFKVFYAPVTLNGFDKKGQKYLTNIFAAVNSAKLMLVIGSKPEYFTAEWVKSEWSRFMALTKNDNSKKIISCFSGMTEKDLPEALEQYQAQNISDPTGILDAVNIVRDSLQSKKLSSSNPADNIRLRGFMALEDEEWDEADKFFEKVLNEYNPTDAECYLGKFMIDLKVHKREDLKKYDLPFDEENLNYKKACRFGKKVKKELDEYNSIINSRIEEAKNSKIYADAEIMLNSAETEKECLDAAEIFKSILSYSDSADRIKECEEKANEITYNTALNKLNSAETEKECSEAVKIFESILSYKDASEKIKECEEKGSILKEKKYADTLQDFKSAKTEAEYQKAGEQFSSVSGYKDSAILSEKCFTLAEDVKEVKEKSKKVLGTMSPTVFYLQSTENSEAVALLIQLSGYKNLKQYMDEVGFKLTKNELYVNTISAGYHHTVGLKKDGTVVAVGVDSNGRCNVSEWKDIVAVSAGRFHTVGLKSDETAVAVGDNSDGQCNVSKWKDIKTTNN